MRPISTGPDAHQVLLYLYHLILAEIGSYVECVANTRVLL